MKKIFYTLIFSLVAFSLSAQGYKSTRIGLINDGGEYSLSYPNTTLSVKLIVEKKVITPGVYARYAQKYLAMRAPLVAQTTYKIIDGVISEVNEGQATESLSPAAEQVYYDSLPADQYSSYVLPADDAARDAAEAIFTIRRQRRDIINGEAGEGYFGAGLKDAMDRMDAMESEYLELFMGTTTITQTLEQYSFSLQEGVSRYVIARFDESAGVMPASDLSGTPLFMHFAPQALPDTSAIAAQPKSKETMLFRFAAPTECTLYNDSERITSTTLPIYEFGADVKVEIPVSK